MKEIFIAITNIMPKDENGNIIDKQLHSDIINAIQQVTDNNNFINNKSSINPKLNITDIKVNIPYIICAAIWFKDGKFHEHQPRNIDSGLVVCGR